MNAAQSTLSDSLNITPSKAEVMRCMENLYFIADLMAEQAKGALASSMYPSALKDAADALSLLWTRLEERGTP